MASNRGAQSPIQTYKYYKDFKTNNSESLSTHLDTSMILYIMILMCDTSETRLKDSAGDTPIGWRIIPTYAINLMKRVKTIRRLRRKLFKTYVPDRAVIYKACALQDFHKLSNVLLNVTMQRLR